MEASLAHPYRPALDAELSWSTQRGRAHPPAWEAEHPPAWEGEGARVNYKYSPMPPSGYLLARLPIKDIDDDSTITIRHQEPDAAALGIASTSQPTRSHRNSAPPILHPTTTRHHSASIHPSCFPVHPFALSFSALLSFLLVCECPPPPPLLLLWYPGDHGSPLDRSS